ncbi:MAG: SDR family oxidoreductase [Firmicutes bacterium]|nr:SDR family oxidoreductase [Bacillota bacterium]
MAREGARVAVVARGGEAGAKVVEEIAAAGGEASFFRCNVSSREQVDAMVDAVVQRFGSLEILVNNAGTLSRLPFEDIPEDEWDRVIATNVKSVYLCCQAAGREMIRRGYGRIVNITSIWQEEVLPNRTVYSASKAAVRQLTRVLAAEWGRHNITVNSVAPGVMMTEMARPVLSDPAVSTRFVSRTSTGRLGDPEDLCGLVIYLASEESRHVSGQSIRVDGGYY